MHVVITINCDNAAFYNPDERHDPAAELASILERYCSHNLRDGTIEARLFDTNGNSVGTCQIFKPKAGGLY